jgi:hypothetical protein
MQEMQKPINGCGGPSPAPISAIPAISAPPSAEPDGTSGDDLDIPDFLDRRPAHGPPGASLDDINP